jgi:hypothetical protein
VLGEQSSEVVVAGLEFFGQAEVVELGDEVGGG